MLESVMIDGYNDARLLNYTLKWPTSSTSRMENFKILGQEKRFLFGIVSDRTLRKEEPFLDFH